jgi:hypothetical protein
MFRQKRFRDGLLIGTALVLLFLSASEFTPAARAAPPDQTPDMCALLAPGATKVTPIFRGCDGKYPTGKFKGTGQKDEILATADVFQDISVASAQSLADCSSVRNDPYASKKCAPLNIGDKGYDLNYDPPMPRWFGRFARSCYYAEVLLDTSTDAGGQVVDQDLVNRGREILRQIDEKLKTAPPCAGAQLPVPGRLTVGIGGNYDQANERVSVTAGVENRPNVGVGDDYYEWTLDGASIKQGKELKSIQVDTSNLAAGEHEIVAKVTDLVNNVSGGATYKFTVKRATTNTQPQKPPAPAQVQIITPAGTQTANPTVKTPATLRSGKAEIQARCDAVVYRLLTYLISKEGDDPETMMFQSRALGLAILVQAYCDKLLALRPLDSAGALARPQAQQSSQDAGATIVMELQDGIGQFEITHPKAAVTFETATARVDAFGKQTLIVAYDPATQTTFVRALDGSVRVSPKNDSLGALTLNAGEQVKVNADSIGPISPAVTAQAPRGAVVVNAVDNDPENKLWNCETNRVPFGNEDIDRSRCFTFRYQPPAGGISSAVMNVSLNTLGSLQDTDATAIAVGRPYQPCEWGYGSMPGCVVVHGGFEGKHQSLTLDLLDIACGASVQGSPEAQQLVRDQLQTGVVHMILEDDTAVYAAQLVLNGGPPSATCGASEQPMQTLPPSGGATGGDTGGEGGGGTGGGTATGATNVPGTTLPLPPFGSPEPNTSLTGMFLQVAQRRVAAGELVMVPVWLINGQGVANMNFDLTYDANVARPEGTILKGNLLDIALLSTNANTPGILRAGFAQDVNLNGTGTIAYIPFRAVGKAGDRTALMPAVTVMNSQVGVALSIDRIPGEIMIVGPGESLEGDCDGDGSITTLDALCALEMSVQLRAPLPALDADNNGSVTSRDAAILLQRALEIRR